MSVVLEYEVLRGTTKYKFRIETPLMDHALVEAEKAETWVGSQPERLDRVNRAPEGAPRRS